jgi:BMFP domain-containing protein YqiC
MAERPRILDDLAGVAGGAISALAGLRDEAGSVARARAEDIIRRLNLVQRDELDAAMAMAANARAGQEAAAERLAEVLARLAALEARVAALEPKAPSGGGPGMIA